MLSRIIWTWIAALTVFATVSELSASTHASHPGKAIYARGCVTCHGDDGSGAMPGVPDLGAPGGAWDQDDAKLLAKIMKGVPSEAMAMPPKGGDEELTEAGARQVLNYMRRAFGNTRPGRE